MWKPVKTHFAAGLLSVVLVAALWGSACDRTPAEPLVEDEPDVWGEHSPWPALFQTAKAWGGRVRFTFPDEEGGNFAIKWLDPREAAVWDDTMAAMDDDPICSISDDPGLREARRYRDCLNEARDNDVCENGGKNFDLEWDEDEEMWHVHCPKE